MEFLRTDLEGVFIIEPQKILLIFIKNIIPQISNEMKEIYRFRMKGYCSWYDFASEIVNLARVDCKINAIEIKDYPSLAKRPSYSVLSKEKGF